MDLNFENNSDFLSLIKTKENQILERTTDKIQESEGFKVVFAGLKSMLKNNAFHGSKLVLINETEMSNITLGDIGDFNELFANADFAYNHVILIDGKINIISKERTELPKDSNDARNYFSEVSKKGNVVFLLIKNKVNYFIKGADKSESPFFSIADVNKYNEKKDISEINDVLVQYQESLKNRKSYCKFFVELSHLKSLHKDLNSTDEEKKFILESKHLLRNKPEDTFRDDLRQFLSFNLKVSQVKEFLLENMRRLDIYLYDEYGEIYLIEVKWVGQSVHQTGKKMGTSYDSSDIDPNAFIQALDYLQELDNKGENIVRAYLVVFDARKDNNLADTGNDFDSSLLTPVQTKHYRKFEKIKDLRVINFHPS